MGNVESEQIKKTSVGAEAKKNINKEFLHHFKHGTQAKLKISIELTNHSPKDFRGILSLISMSAREFYLMFARKFNSKP